MDINGETGPLTEEDPTSSFSSKPQFVRIRNLDTNEFKDIPADLLTLHYELLQVLGVGQEVLPPPRRNSDASFQDSSSGESSDEEQESSVFRRFSSRIKNNRFFSSANQADGNASETGANGTNQETYSWLENIYGLHPDYVKVDTKVRMGGGGTTTTTTAPGGSGGSGPWRSHHQPRQQIAPRLTQLVSAGMIVKLRSPAPPSSSSSQDDEVPNPSLKEPVGAIWCLSISEDSHFVAGGTQKGTVLLWELCYEEEGLTSTECPRIKLSAVELPSLKGHVGAVIHVSWQVRDGANEEKPPGTSATTTKFPPYILATCSLDKSVRVWGIQKADGKQTSQCLTVIRCPDWPITSAFFPFIKGRTGGSSFVNLSGNTANGSCPLSSNHNNPQMLIASLDGSIQKWTLKSSPILDSEGEGSKPIRGGHFPLWTIVAEVSECFRIAAVTTCLSISPSGEYVVVGTHKGQVTLFSARNFQFLSEFDCRNKRGKYAGGEKVSGVDWATCQAGSFLCVTTNDSRIRLMDLKDYSRTLKFKGHSNTRLLLKGSFDPTYSAIIAPSENRRICFWDVYQACHMPQQIDGSTFSRPFRKLSSSVIKGSGGASGTTPVLALTNTLTSPEEVVKALSQCVSTSLTRLSAPTAASSSAGAPGGGGHRKRITPLHSGSFKTPMSISSSVVSRKSWIIPQSSANAKGPVELGLIIIGGHDESVLCYMFGLQIYRDGGI